MRRSDVEPCIYYIRDSDITVIILAYVDDYLVATNSRSWYDNFVTAFNSQYACKDLGVLDLLMGIGVRWGPGVAYLSQSGYISQMIQTYGLKDAKPASLPMSPGCSLAPSDVYLCGSLQIFSSIMQRCVSLSTTEAEIIAMSEGAREVKYIINVLTDLVDICTPARVRCPGEGSDAQVRGPMPRRGAGCPGEGPDARTKRSPEDNGETGSGFTRNHSEQRGLAAPVATDDAHHGPRRYGEARSINQQSIPEAFHQPVPQSLQDKPGFRIPRLPRETWPVRLD
eukprot:gene30372-biopygen31664